MASWRIFLLLCLSSLSLTSAWLPSFSATTRVTTTHVPLASSSQQPPEEDEISKLIGKRSQIKRKRKEDEEEKFPDVTITGEEIKDLDLDKLPQFKTERPVRRAKGEDENVEETKTGKKTAKPDVPIVDFKADYEDENDFHIPNRIGISTRCWGDESKGFLPAGKLTKRMIKAGKFVPGDLQLAFNQLLEGGITFFETAATYGAASRGNKLSAEDILARCLEEAESDLPDAIIMGGLGASTWTKPLPGAMARVLNESCERIGQSSFELYQVPKSFGYPSSLLINTLATSVEQGSCNYIGVQDITKASTLRRFCKKLEARDMTLTSNSFDFSLTQPRNELMIAVCKQLGVIPLISNPLDNGLASGVYTATNPSGGQAGGLAKFSFKTLEKLQPLHSVQETVTERVRTRVLRDLRNIQERVRGKYGPPPKINTDITTTQVALNYIIAKGGVPLVEVNSPKQAEEALGCLGWDLVDEEVQMLDAAVALCRL